MYFELHTKSNYSFLEGASHPEELVARAAELGYRGLAITDRNSLAGVVRGHVAARESKLPLVIGAELHMSDGLTVVAWAEHRAGYGRLCKLLTLGRRRAAKGGCLLHWDDLLSHQAGLLVGLVPRRTRTAMASLTSGAGATDRAAANTRGWRDHQRWLLKGLQRIHEAFGDRGYLLVPAHRGLDDRQRIEWLTRLARRCGVQPVAAGDALYHTPDRMLAQDCLVAIRRRQTIDQIHAARPSNSQRHLRSIDELHQIYGPYRELLQTTVTVADRCRFRLDELRYEYPEELAPTGESPIDYLTRLVHQGACRRYPNGVPEKVQQLLAHELELIGDLRYEAYFLTVWDLVRFARSRGILCQGRGSAANSAVCFCLEITAVDPERSDLLFERFISRERNEVPDIDVDFEHQRREEVLQYLYGKYGRHRAGLTATVITYRSKRAIREVGAALGWSADVIDPLAKLSESQFAKSDIADRCRRFGLDPDTPAGQRFVYLVQTLIGFPRHLSQHVGGMVMTRGPLDELCPIENAAMPERTVIQWDKDDLDALGILKVDCLALGMLSALRRCMTLVEQHHGRAIDLASIPEGDEATYDMICRADTVGVFQIESRAQMSMLPRLRPRCFYDLVIEVAIVRPGPIQGQMVHPYLKARKDPSTVTYPNDAIREVLKKTLGVPIFQEQAMRLAVVAAGFTPGEADQLRRAMAAWRRPGVIDRFRQKLIDGMQQRGLQPEFAERVFNQLRGFGEYGFPESHAASFALLTYASCYLKCHYPAAFCAALLNSQPLGFYAPAQLVADARRHGVEVRPADVNYSSWECTLENPPPDHPDSSASPALRLGLSMIRGLSEEDGQRLLMARNQQGTFPSLSELTRRARLSTATLTRLADADALRSLTQDRRAALWMAMSRENQAQAALPLWQDLPVDDEPIPASLLALDPQSEVYADYAAMGLSLRGHPLSFCRQALNELRAVPISQLDSMRHGRYVRIAGLVLLRQRPGTAKGVTFVSLEDETGTANLVLFPNVWREHFPLVRQSNAWLVQGQLENRENVIHLVVRRVEDLSTRVPQLTIRSRDFH
jgi:error-prone DNA polymerase